MRTRATAAAAVVAIAVAWLAAAAAGHDVVATIINDSGLTLHLTESRVRWGDVNQLPAVLLGPYEHTQFSLSSPTVGVDEITYKFGYTPEEVWCETIDPPLQLTGEYKYTFGANDCYGDFQRCYNNNNLTLTYTKCSGLVGSTKPTYTISLQQPPPPPSPSPSPTPTVQAPTPPPTPVAFVQGQPVQQKIDCGIGGTQTTMLAATYPVSAPLNSQFVIQIGGDPANPGQAAGSAIHAQNWLFQLPPGLKPVGMPQIDNVGTQGTVLSGGGTLAPLSVSVQGQVVTMVADGKCNNGSVFVPPGFNITVQAVAGGAQAVTMNGDPTYTSKAIVNVECTAILPLTALTSTVVS